MKRGCAALAVAFALVACGGDDDGDDAAPTTTASTVASTSTPSTTTTTEPDLETAPVAGATPDAMAAQLETAQATIDDPSASTVELAAAGHLQQVVYRALAAAPADWVVDVKARVPESLRDDVDANVEAGRQLRALVRNPRPNLPAWRIVAAEPAEVLLEHYRSAQAEFGVPWQYLAAVHLTETRMGRIRGTSTAGAKGPMQFLPSTWEAYGEGDIEDTGDSIRAAARYLAANGAPGDMDNALYRYNPTDKYVTAVKLYASQMMANERQYLGYHAWQVYYWSTLGDVWLRVGYEATEERPVTPEDVA